MISQSVEMPLVRVLHSGDWSRALIVCNLLSFGSIPPSVKWGDGSSCVMDTPALFQSLPARRRGVFYPISCTRRIRERCPGNGQSVTFTSRGRTSCGISRFLLNRASPGNFLKCVNFGPRPSAANGQGIDYPSWPAGARARRHFGDSNRRLIRLKSEARGSL
jgi:hypothetical protein